jgi:hypothetical protein
MEWCAAHATAMHAEVIAVFSIDLPVYAASGFGYLPIPEPTEPDHDNLRDVMQREWCAPLSKASIPFRAVVLDGSPAFAELLLGSTSHQLSLHLNRPLVIVP